MASRPFLLPRRKANFLAAAAVSIVSIGQGFATDRYVATTGNDSNPGTEAQPWKTIQKAADTLAAGDTAYVRAGTYARVTVNVSGTAKESPVTIANYPGEAPVIDATGVTPPSGNTALFLIEGRKHVVIRGFELRNYQTTDRTRTPAGVFISGACENIQILQCHIHDIRNTGGTVANPGNAFGIAVYGDSLTAATGIVIDGNQLHDLKTGASECLVLNGNVTNFQVTRNQVHDNNNIGIDFIGFEGTCPSTALDQARDGVCRGNVVWNISSENNQAYTAGDYSAGGIYCDGATRVLIEGNTSHHNDIGIELAAELAGKVTSAITCRNNFVYASRQAGLFLGGYESSGTGGTDGCAIQGNTFFNNDTLQWDNGEAQLRYRTSNCTFRGNIFHAPADGWLITAPYTAAHNTNNLFDYNLYYSTTPQWKWNNAKRTTFATWKTTSAQDANSLFADPKFVSTASPDLHLRLDSPAIDAGPPAYTPASGELDIDAAIRLSGSRIEIGADELVPMDAWRHQKFGTQATDAAIAGSSANPAKDGLNNLLKYTLGIDPLTSSRSTVEFREEAAGDTRYPALRFTRRISATDVSCTVQISENLADWQDGSRYGSGGEIAANDFTTEVQRLQSGELETITVRGNAASASGKARFLRLLIQQP